MFLKKYLSRQLAVIGFKNPKFLNLCRLFYVSGFYGARATVSAQFSLSINFNWRFLRSSL